MKSIFILITLSLTSVVHARCIVEIFASNGDPLGHIFQEATCSVAMPKCKDKLRTLNVAGARCEVTLDIPGGTLPDEPVAN